MKYAHGFVLFCSAVVALTLQASGDASPYLTHILQDHK